MNISPDYPAPHNFRPPVPTAEGGANGATIDLNEILRILRRRLWLIVACVAAAVLVCGYWLSTVTPKYRATAQIMLGQPTSVNPSLEDLLSGIALDTSAIEGEITVLESARLLARVVEALELDKDPEFNPRLRDGPSWFSSAKATVKKTLKGLVVSSKPPEAGGRAASAASVTRDDPESAALSKYGSMIGALRGSLYVRRRGGSTVIEINMSSESPVKAAAVANTLADIYIADQLELKFGSAQQVTRWLSERLSALKAELEKSETRLREFRADLSADATASVLAQEARIAELERAAQAAREEAAAYRARLIELSAARNTAEPMGSGDSSGSVGVAAGTEGADEAASQNAADVMAAAAIDKEIETLQGELAAAEERLAKEVAAVASAQSELREIRARDLVRLQHMERETEANRMIYETFLARFLEAGEIEQLQQPNARVVSYATPPSGPITPKVTASMAISIAAGGFIGLGLAFFLELRQVSLSTADQARTKLGVPVMGEFSRVKTAHGKVLDAVAGAPYSQLADEARSLRNYIALSIDAPVRVAAVTSSLPDEGKSSTCLLLAWASTQMGRSCVIVDADLRRPTISRALVHQSGPDLIDVLKGEAELDDALRFDEAHGFHVLPCLKNETDVSGLLTTENAAALFDTLRRRFDLVLIDSLPMFMVNDAALLARYADMVLFAVRWNTTPAEAVQQCLRILREIGVDRIGAILTMIDRRRERLYRYNQYSQVYREYGADSGKPPEDKG